MRGVLLLGDGEKARIAWHSSSTAKTPLFTLWHLTAAANEEVMTSMFDDGQHQDWTRGLDAFDGNVLFISSSCNSSIGEAFQREQGALFLNAEHVTIENAGHKVIAEQPEDSVAEICAFLSR
ncbi:MAG: hypothetical protein GY822_18155 [Deltaproteobacteria bacterium]|nr:hypothetical protein [Deltaproteobacteria bacterium]